MKQNKAQYPDRFDQSQRIPSAHSTLEKGGRRGVIERGEKGQNDPRCTRSRYSQALERWYDDTKIGGGIQNPPILENCPLIDFRGRREGKGTKKKRARRRRARIEDFFFFFSKGESERQRILGGPTFHVIVLDRCAAVGRFLHLRAIALLRDDAPTWSTQSVSVNRH